MSAHAIINSLSQTNHYTIYIWVSVWNAMGPQCKVA